MAAVGSCCHCPETERPAAVAAPADSVPAANAAYGRAAAVVVVAADAAGAVAPGAESAKKVSQRRLRLPDDAGGGVGGG